MYYTYILLNSLTKRYYIGYSPDLRNRLKEHFSGKVKSTKSNLNYKLVWYCGFPTEKQAIEFEKYLKTGSGIAFMKKRFLNQYYKALSKDNISVSGLITTRSPLKL